MADNNVRGVRGAYIAGLGSTPGTIAAKGGLGGEIEATTSGTGSSGAEGAAASNVPNTDELFQDVQSSTTVDDIRAQEAAERAARREQAENIFNPQIDRAGEIGERREGSGAAQLGIGRGLGLSTAGMSFMNSLQEQTQEAINEVVSQKAAFISQGDIAAMQRADQAIQQLEDRKLQVTLAKIDAGFRIVEQQMSQQQIDIAQQGFQLDMKNYEEGIRRFNQTKEFEEEKFERTQGFEEDKFEQVVSETDKANALDNIARMAESGMNLTDLSSEEKSVLEREAGLPGGSLEMFYSKLLQRAERNEALDDITLQQAQADLARTWQLVSGTTSTDNKATLPGFPDLDTQIEATDAVSSAALQIADGAMDYNVALNILKTQFAGRSEASQMESLLAQAVNQTSNNLPGQYSKLSDVPIRTTSFDNNKSGIPGFKTR